MRLSNRFRRGHVLTSPLQLVELHDAQAGTTLSMVYRP
jgi:hypothetical protein